MPDASDRSTDHGLSPVGVGRLALHDVDCGLELIKAFPQIDAIHVRRSDNQLFQLHRAKMKLGDAGKKLFQNRAPRGRGCLPHDVKCAHLQMLRSSNASPERLAPARPCTMEAAAGAPARPMSLRMTVAR